jgi:hypothetical protein
LTLQKEDKRHAAALAISDETARAELRLKKLRIRQVDFVLFLYVDTRFDIAGRS